MLATTIGVPEALSGMPLPLGQLVMIQVLSLAMSRSTKSCLVDTDVLHSEVFISLTCQLKTQLTIIVNIYQFLLHDLYGAFYC